MTCIEFFDRESIEDICTCFAAKADRVIFIGKDKNMMEKYILRYEQIFSDRGINIAFDTVCVKADNLNDTVDKITRVIEDRIDEEQDFVFDLTGGDDLCLVAMGIVYERFRNLGIQMHRFNLRNNRITDCDADGNLLAEMDTPRISVAENVRIFGGDVIRSGSDRNECSGWDMNDDFIRDVESMWSVLKKLGKYNRIENWNRMTETLAAIESHGDVQGLCSSAAIKAPEPGPDEKNYEIFRETIGLLEEYKLASCTEDHGIITIRYKNDQIKRCLTKAGQVLELIVWLYAQRATDDRGEPVYNDVATGVFIDWDGDIPQDRQIPNIKNEIDVMMMHGVIPVFVSCKNGDFDANELYKLDTVASRFGGKYARKVLVATSLNRNKSPASIRQRAKEMNIEILEPIYYSKETRKTKCMHDLDFQEEIGHAWKYITRNAAG